MATTSKEERQQEKKLVVAVFGLVTAAKGRRQQK